MATIALTRRLATASLLALVALGLAWELWLAPLRPGGSWWALKVLPLIPALPGLLKNRMYTYRWVSLLVWLYVTEGLVRATSDKGLGMALAIGEVALCVVLFMACTVHIRTRLKSAGKDAIAADAKAYAEAIGAARDPEPQAKPQKSSAPDQ